MNVIASSAFRVKCTPSEVCATKCGGTPIAEQRLVPLMLAGTDGSLVVHLGSRRREKPFGLNPFREASHTAADAVACEAPP